MKQSIVFLTVLMVALLLVSGFIVAGNVAQSDQIIAQKTELANLRLNLRAQQSLYDDLLIDTQEQTTILTSITKERDGLKANLESALLSIEETNSALTQQVADSDNASFTHEQEILDLTDSLTQQQLQSSALAADVEDLTTQRDDLSAALATAEADLLAEQTKSVAATASFEESLAADQEALAALQDECAAFIELFRVWENVRSGDASQADFTALCRDFLDEYPSSNFILPELEAEAPTPADQTTAPIPEVSILPRPTFIPIVTLAP